MEVIYYNDSILLSFSFFYVFNIDLASRNIYFSHNIWNFRQSIQDTFSKKLIYLGVYFSYNSTYKCLGCSFWLQNYRKSHKSLSISLRRSGNFSNLGIPLFMSFS